MKESVKKEVEKWIKKYKLNCSIDAFRRKAEDNHLWHDISCHYRVSEEFIEEFQDDMDWWGISNCQNLSEKFIEKFQYRLFSNDNIKKIKKKIKKKRALETLKIERLRQNSFPGNAILTLEL